MIELLKNIDNVTSVLEEAITSYENYETGNTKIISDHVDSVVKDEMSYGEWISTYNNVPVIKVDGLENQLPIESNTVHLFLNNNGDYSFDWHTDDVDVFLYVVKGSKKVYLENEVVDVSEGNGIHIPKGSMHKVYSDNNTWALSIQI